MASGESELETYKAQLEQVEAALLIDEANEDLIKLKQDLLEVITLSEELQQINEIPEIPAEASAAEPTSEAAVEKKKEWKQGDRVQATRQADGKMHNAKIEMIADDGFTCVVKFDNIGAVEVVKVVSLKPAVEEGAEEQKSSSNQTSGGPPKAGKLTKDDIEKRKEMKKKKLLKKKQRMKDFEEQREAGKEKWQAFFKKGTSKGKSKMRGLNKKSIFASREDGKGKIGVGTCGTSGNQMTSYTPASVYMYKK